MATRNGRYPEAIQDLEIIRDPAGNDEHLRMLASINYRLY
jgi:hypothetical protein